MISRVRALLLVLATLAFAAGASVANATCAEASPTMAMGSECPSHHGKKLNLPMTCASGCPAVALRSSELHRPAVIAPIVPASGSPTALADRHDSPDPPPPRTDRTTSLQFN